MIISIGVSSFPSLSLYILTNPAYDRQQTLSVVLWANFCPLRSAIPDNQYIPLKTSQVHSQIEPDIFAVALQILVLAIISTAVIPFVFLISEAPPVPPSKHQS